MAEGEVDFEEVAKNATEARRAVFMRNNPNATNEEFAAKEAEYAKQDALREEARSQRVDQLTRQNQEQINQRVQERQAKSNAAADQKVDELQALREKKQSFGRRAA